MSRAFGREYVNFFWGFSIQSTFEALKKRKKNQSSLFAHIYCRDQLYFILVEETRRSENGMQKKSWIGLTKEDENLDGFGHHRDIQTDWNNRTWIRRRFDKEKKPNERNKWMFISGRSSRMSRRGVRCIGFSTAGKGAAANGADVIAGQTLLGGTRIYLFFFRHELPRVGAGDMHMCARRSTIWYVVCRLHLACKISSEPPPPLILASLAKDDNNNNNNIHKKKYNTCPLRRPRFFWGYTRRVWERGNAKMRDAGTAEGARGDWGINTPLLIVLYEWIQR